MHEFKRFIQQQLDARGWKQADLVRKSGLSKQHVSNMLRDTREHLGQMPDEKTIRALADGFQLPAEVVRTAASRALAGYSDEGQPLHVDIHQVPLDTLLNEIRRRFEEIGDSHGSSTEEVPEPRTQARGPEHGSSTGGDRSGPGASMNRRPERRKHEVKKGKRRALNPVGQAARLDEGAFQLSDPVTSNVDGNQDDAYEELAARTGETQELRRRRTEGEPWDHPDPDGPEGGA